MNFSKEDIMKMVQNGRTTEDIVSEFTKAVNEVESEIAENERKADAEALLARRRTEKIEDMREIVVDFCNYFHAWYPELDEILEEVFKEIDDDSEVGELVDALDAYVELYKNSTKLLNIFDASFNDKSKIKNNTNTIPRTSKNNEEALAEIFENFFKQNNI